MNEFLPSLKTDKVAQKLIRRWIGALRTGTYKQGTGTLRTADNTFCCLGVLCDLVDPRGWSKAPVGRRSGVAAYRHRRAAKQLNPVESRCVMPGKPLGRKLHVTPQEDDLFVVLADLNDSGKSFKVIARKVELAFARAIK